MMITTAGIDRAVTAVHTHRASNVDSTLISQHFPPFVAQALALAAATGDIAGIDQITDATLVKDGMCRPRWDASQLEILRGDLLQRYGSRQ